MGWWWYGSMFLFCLDVTESIWRKIHSVAQIFKYITYKKFLIERSELFLIIIHVIIHVLCTVIKLGIISSVWVISVLNALLRDSLDKTCFTLNNKLFFIRLQNFVFKTELLGRKGLPYQWRLLLQTKKFNQKVAYPNYSIWFPSSWPKLRDFDQVLRFCKTFIFICNYMFKSKIWFVLGSQ